IPLTTNGKVDKKAMPEPSGIGETGVEYAPPTNRTEETLVKIWQEVLGIERVGIHDNFFELGGHSLKATMMVNHIHKQLGVSLPIRELFKNPTIQQLEKYLEEVKLNTYASIPNTKEAEYYPVTSAQRRMYAIQNFEGEKLGVSYNIPEVFEIKGPLDSNKLNVALRKLINRHESLRTSFHLIGEQLVQKVHQEASWNLTKLRAKEYEIKNIIETFIKPFNLSEAPLFRAQLVEIGANHHIFMIDMHHIISDAVSSIIFMDELSQYYVDSELPDLRIQYKDYSAWQNSKEWIQQSEKQMKYWLDCLSGELPVLELPTDYARPPVQQLEGDVFTFEIKPETLSELKEMVHSQETTLFIALLTIYKVLLSKYSGQEDIIVGTPLSGRTHSDLEGIMGVFINTLVLRNQLKEEHKFIDLLSIVREGVLDSFEHADVPIEELISKLTLKRDVSRNPLFDTVFTFEQSEMNIDEAEINIPNLSFKYYDFDSSVAKFDMSWDAEEENGHLFFSVEYCTALFKQSTIERMSRHYIQILEQVIQQPDILLSEIELVTQAEKQQLLKDFNNTQVNYDKEKTIQELFEAQVK
ncbi:condensation domain-containing protein, partial [Bacillus subtilis]